jgi:SH3-like domain-containing protein
VAVQVGPFAEINAGEGDCLNLRTEASTEGRALACIAHGALVERLSPLDGEWVQVRTADGRAGWVSGEWVLGAAR